MKWYGRILAVRKLLDDCSVTQQEISEFALPRGITRAIARSECLKGGAAAYSVLYSDDYFTLLRTN